MPDDIPDWQKAATGALTADVPDWQAAAKDALKPKGPRTSFKGELPKMVTGIPGEIKRGISEDVEAIKGGYKGGLTAGLKGIGAALDIPFEATGLPGAARSIIGHGMAGALHGVGMLTEKLVGKPIEQYSPEELYEKTRTAPGEASAALPMKGARWPELSQASKALNAPRPAAPPAPAAPPGPPGPPPQLPPIMQGGTPRQAGVDLQAAARAEQARQQAGVTQKFEAYKAEPGEFEPEVGHGIEDRLRMQVEQQHDVPINKKLTPQTHSALKELGALPEFRHKKAADPLAAMTGVEQKQASAFTIATMEKGRRILSRAYSQALSAAQASKIPNWTDVRALGKVQEAYQDHFENAVANGLWSGDAKVLDQMREAKIASSTYKKVFENRIMRKLTDPTTTAEEVVKMMGAAGKVGQAGQPVRMWDLVERAVGKDAPILNQWRSAFIDHAASQKGGFTALADSTLGRRMFDGPTRMLIQQIGQTPAPVTAAAKAAKQSLRDRLDAMIWQGVVPSLAAHAAATATHGVSHLLPFVGKHMGKVAAPIVKQGVKAITQQHYGGANP